MINAINMIDGVDGLSGSIAATALPPTRTWRTDRICSQTKTFAHAAGGTLGFMLNMRLPWNPKARIFMGDTG